MLKRLAIYLKEMYPPHHALASFLMGLIYIMALSLIDNVAINWKNPHLYTSAFSVMLMALIIRVMDEFKDYEDDLRNFPNRPLPSGRVKKEDLKVLQTFNFLFCILANMYNKFAIIGISICLLYSLLMYKWFFIEKTMRKSLPLAFLSHHPVTYLYFIYLFLVWLSTNGIETDKITFTSALIGLPIGLTLANWEVSRKIKMPEDENAYTTYSKIWGPKVAVSVAMLFQIISSFVIGIFLATTKVNSIIVIVYFSLFFFNFSKYIIYFKTLKFKQTLKINAENLTLLTQATILATYITNEVLNK